MTSISQPPTSNPPQANSSNVSLAANTLHPSSSSASSASVPVTAVPATTAARSYANATKKTVSPPITSGSSGPSYAVAPVAVGTASVAQHAKSNSVSPMNGKTSSVPSAGAGPNIAQGSNNVVNGSGVQNEQHSRKTSVTISAAGASGYLPNGGPVAGPGRSNSIQFGSFNTGGSPASTHAVPQSSHLTPSVPMATPHNPRVSSPQTSPSPIPQPAASGGRPPSGSQGANAMTFGSLGGDSGEANRQLRPVSMPPQGAPNMIGGPQPVHLRRESSQSTQSEISAGGIPPGPGRGNYPPQGGRGRGFVPPYPQHGQMGYPTGGPGYRGPPNQPRGNLGPHHFQGQGGAMNQFPNAPHRGARSPALTHSVPGTPNMQQVTMASSPMPQQHYGGYLPHMGPQVNPPSLYHSRIDSRQPKARQSSQLDPQPMIRPKSLQDRKPYPSHSVPRAHHPRASFHIPPPPLMQAAPPPNLLAPESGFMEHHLMSRALQTQYPYDPNYGAPFPPQQYMYPGMYIGGGIPPGSPRSPHQQHGYPSSQSPYVVGQYSSPGPQPMSRTASNVSEQQRPGSQASQGQALVMPSVSNNAHHPSQGRASPVPSSNFVRPTRTAAKIVIKDPKSGVVKNLKNLDKVESSTSPVSHSPAIVSSTSTAPPVRASAVSHKATESKSVKTDEEKKNEMINAIAKKLEAEKAEVVEAGVLDPKAVSGQQDTTTAKCDVVANKVEVKSVVKAEEKDEGKAVATSVESIKENPREKAAEREPSKGTVEEPQEASKTKAPEVESVPKQEEVVRPVVKADAQLATDVDQDKNAPIEATKSEEATPESKVADTAAVAVAVPVLHGAAVSLAKVSTATASATTTLASDVATAAPSKVLSVSKHNKPAALNLAPIKTNTVEPPQPSAAMVALRSSRFIDRLSDVTYPGSIASPNPALNAAATKGKFKYDKDFLLQFQPVFTEKPSIDWENKLQQTVGETIGSAGPNSKSMGSRNTSGRPEASAQAMMGSFSQAGPARMGPVPATSAERYAESNRGMNQSRGPMNNPLASLVAKPGGFSMGGAGSISRNSSQTALQSQSGGAPNSPRSGNRSKRENPSKRGNTSERRPNPREEEQNARTMPLTAGLNLAPLLPSSSGWKPRSLQGAGSATGAAGPAPGASSGTGHMEPDMVQRKVKSNLNKMTPEKFEKIADQILEIAAQSKDETDGRTLRQVIQLTFEKATDEAHWASMYAKFCKRMLESMSTDIKDENIKDKNGQVVAGGNLFRKYLLNRCQEEFEQGWKINLPDKPEGETEEAAMLSEEYYIAAAAKRRGLGLVQFIGELYKLNMLTERIMHECVKKLVDYEGMPDEAEVEGLTKLLRTIGYNLDNTDKGRPLMDAYFQRIQAMMETPELPSRLQYMLLDVVDLRRKGWASKEANKGPQTIQEIREEAQRQQAEKEAERARQQNQRHHGGGGRMPAGRGDARSFSGGGQYGMMPPPDLQKNVVGLDDLRRLGSKAGSRQASQGGMGTFGPTSMFSSRSNSGRKPLGGPGSALARGGEDSGASSRTTTPPTVKAKEATIHANTFDALANLNPSDDPVGAASPPSSTASPVLTKAKPAVEQSTAGESKKQEESQGASS